MTRCNDPPIFVLSQQVRRPISVIAISNLHVELIVQRDTSTEYYRVTLKLTSTLVNPSCGLSCKLICIAQECFFTNINMLRDKKILSLCKMKLVRIFCFYIRLINRSKQIIAFNSNKFDFFIYLLLKKKSISILLLETTIL